MNLLDFCGFFVLFLAFTSLTEGYYGSSRHATKREICKGCRGNRDCCRHRMSSYYGGSSGKYYSGYGGAPYYSGHSGLPYYRPSSSRSTGYYPAYNKPSYSSASHGKPKIETGGFTKGDKWVNIEESYSRDIDIYDTYISTNYADKTYDAPAPPPSFGTSMMYKPLPNYNYYHH
mmetsp:Transcript_18835/g.24845  ORF Transcript_18835/g.24845 Transcript_18835/m.24845 type:complete len:174 (+) Transcript_18835:177-698(+)